MPAFLVDVPAPQRRVLVAGLGGRVAVPGLGQSLVRIDRRRGFPVPEAIGRGRPFGRTGKAARSREKDRRGHGVRVVGPWGGLTVEMGRLHWQKITPSATKQAVGF